MSTRKKTTKNCRMGSESKGEGGKKRETSEHAKVNRDQTDGEESNKDQKRGEEPGKESAGGRK